MLYTLYCLQGHTVLLSYTSVCCLFNININVNTHILNYVGDIIQLGDKVTFRFNHLNSQKNQVSFHTTATVETAGRNAYCCMHAITHCTVTACT